MEEFDPIALETLCGNLVEGASDVDCELELALQPTSHRKKSASSKKKKRIKKKLKTRFDISSINERYFLEF